jgi:hypothetical protein
MGTLPSKERISMRITTKTWLVGLALVLAWASVALAQGTKAELWNGTHWKEFSKEIKVAYIKGIGNMADFEVAASGRDQAGCISVGFVDELQGKTLDSIIQDVDKYYKEKPDNLKTPVVEVVLRQCTALCKPQAPAAPPKK